MLGRVTSACNTYNTLMSYVNYVIESLMCTLAVTISCMMRVYIYKVHERGLRHSSSLICRLGYDMCMRHRALLG